MIGKKFIAVLALACAMVANVALAETAPAVSPDTALSLLMQGNARFVKGDLDNLEKNSTAKVRQTVALGQHPYAIILACSDSRLSPEILFDKGLGEIFVVRVAGNVVAPHELGSIDYAVEHLGASLVMVLGHERCGAVTAAFDANGIGDGSNIGSLVESIAPAVVETKAHGGDVEECIVENVKKVAESLEERSSIVKESVEAGHVKIVRAKYDLDDGKVTILP